MLRKAFKTNQKSGLLFSCQQKRQFNDVRDHMLIETGGLANMMKLREPKLRILNTTQYTNDTAKKDHIQARISSDTQHFALPVGLPDVKNFTELMRQL